MFFHVFLRPANMLHLNNVDVVPGSQILIECGASVADVVPVLKQSATRCWLNKVQIDT